MCTHSLSYIDRAMNILPLPSEKLRGAAIEALGRFLRHNYPKVMPGAEYLQCATSNARF